MPGRRSHPSWPTASRRVSKNKAEFGEGAIEGVAAPEPANNAAANGKFFPTLTLGIPGGATTAVLLGAFIVYGVQPGPLLCSFFIGNLILLVLNLPLAPVFAQILRVPYGYLYPLILLTSFVGAFSIRSNIFSVYVVLVAGVIGYAFKRLGWPPAPLVLGPVLGTILEANLVRTSAIGDGSLLVVFSSPIAVAILVLAPFMLFPTDVVKLCNGAREAAATTPRPCPRSPPRPPRPGGRSVHASTPTDQLLVDRARGVLTLTFNRPQQR